MSPLQRWPDRWLDGVAALARRHLGLHGGEIVLDVGCGAGQHLEVLRGLAGAEGRVIGIDYSPRMLARADELIRRQGWDNVELRRGDASRPGFEQPDLAPAFADAALASFAMSAMPDVRAAAGNVWTALRPGGRFLVLDVRLTRPGILARQLGWVYRQLAGWSGEDVLTVLRETFDVVEVVGGDDGRSLVFVAVCVA
ncbi:MAG TPA: class I SAM-dependent methyltransferase [Candidatus Dormibacteraeota bacterium]|nr:class I SAM-dependent methyltransferase [Candidatus Dormibacteraeota bacterium]